MEIIMNLFEKYSKIKEKLKIFLKHRKFNEKRFDTYITKVTVQGDFFFSGQIIFSGILSGCLKGDRGTMTSAIIKKESIINGDVEAMFVIIEGKVVGNIIAEKVIIRDTAIIEGSVHYEYISVEEGAIISGALKLMNSIK
jgi:cytoskeletal protein CcmA (bactofilin family)